MPAVPFITSTPWSTQSYEPRQLLHQNDHWQPVPVNSSFTRSHLNLGSFDSPLGDSGDSACTSDIEKLWEDVHSLITSKFAEMEEQWSICVIECNIWKSI